MRYAAAFAGRRRDLWLLDMGGGACRGHAPPAAHFLLTFQNSGIGESIRPSTDVR
jgi:hypothetical protein